MKQCFLFLSLSALLAISSVASISHGVEPPKKSEILDPKALLEILPRDLLKDVDMNSRNRVEAMDSASQKMRDNFKNSTATMSFEIRNIEKENGIYHIMSAWVKERIAGTTFNTHQVIHFDKAENEKVAKLKVGDKVTATGKVEASVYGKRETLFNVNLGQAKLVK